MIFTVTREALGAIETLRSFGSAFLALCHSTLYSIFATIREVAR